MCVCASVCSRTKKWSNKLNIGTTATQGLWIRRSYIEIFYDFKWDFMSETDVTVLASSGAYFCAWKPVMTRISFVAILKHQSSKWLWATTKATMYCTVQSLVCSNTRSSSGVRAHPPLASVPHGNKHSTSNHTKSLACLNPNHLGWNWLGYTTGVELIRIYYLWYFHGV